MFRRVALPTLVMPFVNAAAFLAAKNVTAGIVAKPYAAGDFGHSATFSERFARRGIAIALLAAGTAIESGDFDRGTNDTAIPNGLCTHVS